MPVVDESGRMLGIVTFDDAMDVIEDDAEEVKTHWAWGQLAISVAIFLVLLVPYTFLILHFSVQTNPAETRYGMTEKQGQHSKEQRLTQNSPSKNDARIGKSYF